MLRFLINLIKKVLGIKGGGSMPRNSEPLSNVDAAWLGMDETTTLMMITGVMTFDKPLNIDHLMAVFEHRWLKFDRFRQRLVQPSLPTGMPYWQIDPHFKLSAHFRHIALPASGNQAALQQVVSQLMSSPLDSSKPLWQIHVVDNYQGGSALVARIHHSIADGLALVYILLSLTDMSPNAPVPQGESGVIEDDDGGLFSGIVGSLFRGGRFVASTAGKWSVGAVRESVSIARNPDRFRELMASGTELSYTTSKLLLRSDDPPTPFKGELGTVKRGAWSKPLPLRDIKAIKNATHTTVNDVLISAMSGALRRYMLSAGYEPQDFRATVPVNLRTAEEMGRLGNKFGLVFLNLPVSIGDPLARLSEVHYRMQQLKQSPEAGIILNLLNIVGRSARQVQDVVVSLFAKKATAVLTNVPGPPMPLYLAGRQIQDIMFWVPQAGRLGLGLSILSYAGKVYIGVATDARLVDKPEHIVSAFYDELDLLMANLNLTPSAKKQAPAKSMAPQKDDLTQIQGIDEAVAAILAQNGIVNFQQLGKMNPQTITKLIAESGLLQNGLNLTNWPAQARYLNQIEVDES